MSGGGGGGKEQEVKRRPKSVPKSVQAHNSSVQFKMVSMHSEKPICAPPRLSDVIEVR